MPEPPSDKAIGALLPEDEPLERGENWLFLIGIDEYAGKPLANCVRDARTLKEVLTKRYLFEENRTRELYNHEATRGNILDVLREFIRLPVGPADSLVIYYSGHGILDEDLNTFCWVPLSAEINDKHLRLTQADLVLYLKMIKARHIFLIADSCFSGTMFDPHKSLEGLPERLERDPSRWGLSSGRRELVSDGRSGSHSPFAESLIEVLLDYTAPLPAETLSNQVIYLVSEVKQCPRHPGSTD